MNECDVQDMLKSVIENLIDAREEVEGDDDDGELACIARDLVDESQEFKRVSTYERDQILTMNKGLVLRTDDGSEFQITIVKSR